MARVLKGRLTFLPKGLLLTDEEFESLHKVIEKTRAKSVNCALPKQAAVNLLHDYSVLLARIDEVEGSLRDPAVDNRKLARPVDETAEDAEEDLI